MKTDFLPFEVGTVLNPLPGHALPSEIKPKYKSVIINYPFRLEAMAIDPSKIAINKNLVYTPGQVDISIDLYRKISISITSPTGSKVRVSASTSRPSLVKHAVLIMNQALGIDYSYTIDIEDKVNLRHCGLGSSSSLLAGVACAINELFDRPIDKKILIKYLAQNHGEEIDGDENSIMPVQCIGGSAACGMYDASVIILAGESTVIATGNLDNSYSIVIGIPTSFEYPDSKYLMEEEEKNLDKFMDCGRSYGQTIAYKMLHSCLPALAFDDIKPLGDLVFDYRFKMGSIENCSFVFPPMVQIAKNLMFLKEQNHVDLISLSSVGPGFFAITKAPQLVEKAFQDNGLITYLTKPNNQSYQVISLT